MSNLLECVDTVNDMLANGEDVDIFYLYFGKKLSLSQNLASMGQKWLFETVNMRFFTKVADFVILYHEIGTVTL